MIIKIPLLFVYLSFGAIGALVIVIFVILLKMGTAGRFWLRHNLLKGNSPVLIAQTHTNALKHYSVKDDGRNLRWGRDRFMFLPGLARSADEKNELTFNEINKATGHIDGKPVFMGSVSASVACNPKLLDVLARSNPDIKEAAPTEIEAKINGEPVAAEVVPPNSPINTLLEDLKKAGAEAVRDVHLLAIWSIKDLAEIMNIVITPQRLKTVYDYGEMKGRNIVKTKETLLFIVIFALLAAVCFLAYMVSRP